MSNKIHSQVVDLVTNIIPFDWQKIYFKMQIKFSFVSVQIQVQEKKFIWKHCIIITQYLAFMFNSTEL